MRRIVFARFFSTHRSAHRTARGWRSPAVPVCLAVLLTAGLAAQTPAPKPAAKPAAAAPARASGVDKVIALVKGGMSEGLVIKSLQRDGKAYELSTDDLVKLQKAGVSERIIEAMMDPGPAAAASTPASVATPNSPTAPTRTNPELPGAASAFPPDLPDVPTSRKRLLAVSPFDYSTVTSWVNYWFNNNVNIGDGIRSMLTVRLQQSKSIRLLERAHLKTLTTEQDLANSNRMKPGSGARTGQLLGADVQLLGDIVIFGRDDVKKGNGIGGVIRGLPGLPGLAGRVATMSKEEKAVVAINLRIVDTETGEVIETAEARGESSRKSKDYAGVLGGQGAAGGAAVGGGGGMTSSNFQQTIIGEATSNAVTKIVEYLESKIPQMPAKPREIEGRVAQITSGGAYLTVGGDNGVMRGDRFEILKINEDIKDPVTKQVIGHDTVKIGELVVDTVNATNSSGRYGGQPMSPSYMTGKGYVSKLVSK